MDMEYKDFYNSDDAEQMAQEYKESINKSSQLAGALLIDADILEKQCKQMTSIFLKRRRIRLELSLQRQLLEILLTIPATETSLNLAVYERLLNCLARLDKLC